MPPALTCKLASVASNVLLSSFKAIFAAAPAVPSVISKPFPVVALSSRLFCTKASNLPFVTFASAILSVVTAFAPSLVFVTAPVSILLSPITPTLITLLVPSHTTVVPSRSTFTTLFASAVNALPSTFTPCIALPAVPLTSLIAATKLPFALVAKLLNVPILVAFVSALYSNLPKATSSLSPAAIAAAELAFAYVPLVTAISAPEIVAAPSPFKLIPFNVLTL